MFRAYIAIYSYLFHKITDRLQIANFTSWIFFCINAAGAKKKRLQQVSTEVIDDYN